jgi:hypothetical protein
VLGGVRDGFVRADRIAAHAVNIERVVIGAADRDSEADMRTAHIGHEPQHGGMIEVIPAR